MNECVAKDGTGDLLGLLEVPDISNFNVLLDGFKEFDQVSDQIDSYTESKSINESEVLYN